MKKYRVKLPEFSKLCQRCGRKLDGRAVNNPFGFWSVPTYVNGYNYCGYCAEIVMRKWDAVEKLDPACVAKGQLDKWLAQPSPFPDQTKQGGAR
jgi:Fe-S-cluster formation regulator IscX/YfhJ